MSKQHPCPCCDIKCSTERLVYRHIKKVHPNQVSKHFKYSCNQCDEYLWSARSLTIHINKKHKIGTKRPQCPYCIFSSSRTGYLFSHIRESHPKQVSKYFKFECHQCKKRLATDQALKKHISQEHSTNKTCKECDQTFKTQADLKIHFDRFHAPQIIKCDESGCVFKCGSSYLLQVHKSNVHVDKKFKCPDKLCRKQFKTKTHVDQHFQLVHGPQSKGLSFYIYGKTV